MNFSSPPSISILRLFALSLLSACTPASTQQCPVQADQKSSFMAAAEHFPLSIRAEPWHSNLTSPDPGRFRHFFVA